MNTPIYDQLRTELLDGPGCPTCGDYALAEHIQTVMVRLAAEYVAAIVTMTDTSIVDATAQFILETIRPQRHPEAQTDA